MRWEVCEWRGHNIEDGAAIHNAQQQQQWRISLKNIKGRRGRERVCNCVTFPYRKVHFLDNKLEFSGIKIAIGQGFR